MLSLVINFNDKYNTVNCKLTNKNSVYHKWYHTYQHSLENLNQFIDKFPKKIYNVLNRESSYLGSKALKIFNLFSETVEVDRSSTSSNTLDAFFGFFRAPSD